MGLMLLVLWALVGGTDWHAAGEQLAKSTVFIESHGGSCTGFVINTTAKHDKEDVDYVLTAAHCDGEGLLVDQTPAITVAKDNKKDLLVVAIARSGKPALRLAKDNPKQGDEVASLGYGYGLERPMLRVTHIADDNTYIPEDGIGGPLMITDAAFVGGQSGGPVVNAAGEVVMIVQRGTGTVGIGVGAETIRSKVGRYFEKAVK